MRVCDPGQTETGGDHGGEQTPLWKSSAEGKEVGR